MIHMEMFQKNAHWWLHLRGSNLPSALREKRIKVDTKLLRPRDPSQALRREYQYFALNPLDVEYYDLGLAPSQYPEALVGLTRLEQGVTLALLRPFTEDSGKKFLQNLQMRLHYGLRDYLKTSVQRSEVELR